VAGDSEVIEHAVHFLRSLFLKFCQQIVFELLQVYTVSRHRAQVAQVLGLVHGEGDFSQFPLYPLEHSLKWVLILIAEEGVQVITVDGEQWLNFTLEGIEDDVFGGVLADDFLDHVSESRETVSFRQLAASFNIAASLGKK
jgi:hypothetical protein